MAMRILHQLLPAQVYLEFFDFNPETGAVLRKKSSYGKSAGDHADYDNGHGYRVLKLQGSRHPVHRVMYHIFGGSAVTPDLEVDHINRDRSDNRISNLRLVTAAQNMQNKTKYTNNNTGVTGVSRRTDYRGNSLYVSYVSMCGKLKSRSFSINKYGEEGAKRLAAEWRTAMVALHYTHAPTTTPENLNNSAPPAAP